MEINTKLVPLPRGQVMQIDEADYPEISRFTWHAHWNRNNWYALTNVRVAGKQRTYSLHRHLLGLNFGDIREGDHINNNTLDNRRSNLRICTHRQNTMNRRLRWDNASGVKGVYLHRPSGRYTAQIRVNGKLVFLGYHANKELAAEAYKIAAVLYFGEFARVA